MKIGIGITTHNRPDMLAESLKFIKFHTPDAKIVVVDDASDTPVDGANYRFEENVGIARAKNKCLELLDDCDHIFLFDDDTYPKSYKWWVPYVESPEPHLMYQFTDGPSHWNITLTYADEKHTAYDKARGCMLYIDRKILPYVGGMSYAFGKHGGEHEDWSRRIHKAGLTRFEFMDVIGSNDLLYCNDQHHPGISSVDYSQNQAWRHIDAGRIPSYQEYRTQDVPVLVPRRDDRGFRDTLWRHLKKEYWSCLSVRIVEGYHTDGKFNRSKALNGAASIAGNWDVALIADSDAFTDHKRVDEAIALARSSGRLVSLLTSAVEVDEQTTKRLIEGELIYFEDFGVEKIRVENNATQSLLLAVPRTVWEQVCGFDEKFVGWGGEDNAFWKACEIVSGEPIRLEGPVYHLWHESSALDARRTVEYQSNYQRWVRYSRATTRRDLELI